jgi:hypothetical protein
MAEQSYRRQRIMQDSLDGQIILALIDRWRQKYGYDRATGKALPPERLTVREIADQATANAARPARELRHREVALVLRQLGFVVERDGLPGYFMVRIDLPRLADLAARYADPNANLLALEAMWALPVWQQRRFPVR